MQTACNTPRTSITPALPLINDPSLDSVQPCRAPEPSHEEIMLALESETQSIWQPKSPFAKALFALGLESKSRRADECGSKRFFRCKDHPDQTEEQHRTCRLKTCHDCAPRLSEERITKFWDNQPYMRTLKQYHCIYMHLPSQDTVPSREEIQAFNQSISQWIKKFRDPRPGTGAISHVTIETSDHGLDPGRFRLAARVLWWGELYFSALARGVAPGCNTHSVQPGGYIREGVKEVMSHRPPKSPETCAQIELVANNLRLIRSHGQMLKKDLLLDEDTLQVEDGVAAAEASVTEEVDTVTNASQKPITPRKCCKKCGNEMTEVSDWVSRYAPAAELKQLKWIIMNNAPPSA